MTSVCKMLAGRPYIQQHNQVAGIVYWNICAEYGLEVPRSKCGEWLSQDPDIQKRDGRLVMDDQMDIEVMADSSCHTTNGSLCST